MILEPSISSGAITVVTSLNVTSSPGLLHSVILHPGSAASSIIVYDQSGTAASGTVLCKLLGVANGASVVAIFPAPIYTTRGIAVAVAGTAAEAVVTYTKG